ncbi:hypothetical protein ACQPZG_31305 [Streptomyces sp. CA-294286]
MASFGACPVDLSLTQTPDNPSGQVVYDEQAMAIGTALHTTVALDFLSR